MSKKSIPDGLKKLQEEKKNETLDNIQRAINCILQDGDIVSKKKLLEITGLSSGTFSKDYVKKLLKQNNVCQFQNSNLKCEKNEKNYAKILEKELDEKEKNLKKCNSRIQDLEIIVTRREKMIKELNVKIEKLDENYKRLKGKMFLVIEEADRQGVTINTGKDIL